MCRHQTDRAASLSVQQRQVDCFRDIMRLAHGRHTHTHTHTQTPVTAGRGGQESGSSRSRWGAGMGAGHEGPRLSLQTISLVRRACSSMHRMLQCRSGLEPDLGCCGRLDAPVATDSATDWTVLSDSVFLCLAQVRILHPVAGFCCHLACSIL